MIKLLVAGEGNNELGPGAPDDPARHGVIEALLQKVRPGDWQICETVMWANIPKLRPNSPGRGEVANVNGIILRARERGYHAVVFVRDRDRDRRRQKAIESAVQQAPKLVRSAPRVVGGVAVEDLEAWLLALKGVAQTETLSETAAVLEQQYGIARKKTGPMVNLVLQARLRNIPADAQSLRLWLRRAAAGLGVRVPRGWP